MHGAGGISDPTFIDQRLTVAATAQCDFYPTGLRILNNEGISHRRMGVVPSYKTLLHLSARLLAGALVAAHLHCSGGMSEPGPGSPASETAASAIATENALPGSSEWTLDRPITDQQIVAYPERESYAAGTDVPIAVSAQPAGLFRWKLFRMGGYGGSGARVYAEGGPLAARRQPDPVFEQQTGLVVTGWPPTFTVSTRHLDGSPWLT